MHVKESIVTQIPQAYRWESMFPRAFFQRLGSLAQDDHGPNDKLP